MSVLGEYIAVLLLESAGGDQNEQYGGSVSFIEGRLSNVVTSGITGADVEEALTILEPFAAAERDFSPLTGGFWHVQYDNFRYYFEQSSPDAGDDPADYERLRLLAEKYPILMAYARRGSPYARDAERALQALGREDIERLRNNDTGAPKIGNIPASNRIVTIDHNSSTYTEVVGLTETAAEAIRASNTLDEEKRGWIREHLAAGLDLIKRHKVLATAASALLLQPLLNAYEAVSEEPAKQAILAAIKAIRAFFGIL